MGKSTTGTTVTALVVSERHELIPRTTEQRRRQPGSSRDASRKAANPEAGQADAARTRRP